MKMNKSIIATIAGTASLGIAKSFTGSSNKGEISIVRVETRRSRVGGHEHMKALSRGRMFDPNKVVGATITLEGSDPQKLRTYMAVEDVLRNETRKLGLFGKMLTFMNLYPSRSKPDTWEAKWEIR